MTAEAPADVLAPDVVALAEALRADRGLLGKTDIAESVAALGLGPMAAGRPGDDCAALPDGDGWTLFAVEGFINAFVAADPWFAGWCGVMVNLSDVAAMGGRPTAVVNALWAPDGPTARPVLEGMRAAAAAYGVPMVGGHTNLRTPQAQLAVAVLGRARALITSFDARPGDVLVAAVDHRGAYREPFDNWQAALSAPPDRLRGDLGILPDLAEDGLVRAGKDISQGGIVGTALMLAECSGVGIDIDPACVRTPPGVALARWLRSFPSFGFLLSVAPASVEAVCTRFAARGIDAGAVGRVVAGSAVSLVGPGGRALVRDHAAEPYLGLGEPADA
jgi:AIR synthase-related protein